MAGTHGVAAAIATTASFPLPPATLAAPITRKSLLIVSSLSSPFPSKRTRRTNHLRKKILKTLENKPYPDTYLPEFPHKAPIISIEETTQQQPAEVDQFLLSEATGFVDGIVGRFSTRSFIKIGLYLVGAFVFQTICAVLIFGSNDLEGEGGGQLNSNDSKRSRVLNLGVNGNNQWDRNLIGTKEGGIVLVDESEMDKRIVEIQEMAREVRQSEANKKGLVQEVNDDADFDSIDKTMKFKEVDDRLMKLQKSLENNYEKLPHKISRKDDVNNDVDKGMFKKKYKFKSPSIDTGDKPKGFDGITADNAEQIDLPNGHKLEISVPIIQDENKEQKSLDESMPISEPRNELMNRSERANPRAEKTESIAGTSKELKYDKQAVGSVKSEKSSNLEARKPRGFGKESQSDTSTSIKHDDFNRNGGLKGKKGRNRKSARNLEDMKSSTEAEAEAEFWWTRLPYVLAVLMQRGDGEGEESEGLFTLRSDFETKSGLSHTVAFEDRGDAKNFCYLLESFFEDLGDFSTDIIPIPTNELEEAVKSQMMKVVVVKKGQLQLYASQPLADVETALRTLIKKKGKL